MLKALKILVGISVIGAVTALVFLTAIAYVLLLQHLGQVMDGAWLMAVLVFGLGIGIVLGYVLQRRWFVTQMSSRLKWGLIFIVGVIAFISSFFYEPILLAIGDALYITETPQQVDGIWVLGTLDERYELGSDLYLQGYAPQMLMSLGLRDIWLLFKTESLLTNRDAIRDYVLRRGVPETDIRFFNAENTYEETLRAREYVRENNLQSLIVASSPAHMFRVKMIFEHVVGPYADLTFVSVPIEKSLFVRKWWTDEFSLGRVFYEYMSIPYYRLVYMR